MDKSDYKMTQTEMHAFEIHDKPSGALLATITREPGGGWSTHPAADSASESGDVTMAQFEQQAKPQAAFDAFIARLPGRSGI